MLRGMFLRKSWLQLKRFIILAGPVLIAQEPGPGGAVGQGPTIRLPNPLPSDNIIEIINNILNYLIYISIPILALMILWGGFQILYARGAPANITKGRETIQWAVIGFVIILISKGVALIVLRILG